MRGSKQVSESVPAEDAISARAVRVDAWNLSLLLPAADTARLGRLLAPDEAAAVARMAPGRRGRTLVAWAARRTLLAHALRCEPGDIVFDRSESGAPRLVSPEQRVHFSLSHSGDAMLFALSAARIGADIERIDPRVDAARLARRFFTATEAESLTLVPARETLREFFGLWTRKEALLKATGGGVPSRLRTFSLCDAEHGRLLRVGSSVWTVREIPTIEGHAAALAVEGEADIYIHSGIGDTAGVRL
jgi:4'-phosphopantetheinyl transferase